MSDTARLLDKLQQLRQSDRERTLYGAYHHRYQLEPTIAEVDLAQFERLHRVTLPDDYRDFLLHAGGGGAGPFNGLYTFQAAIIGPDAEFLATPFKYQQWWNGINPPNWWDLPNAHDLDEHSAPHCADYGENAHIQGTLRLAHEGCGYYSIRVINGAERGHMWNDDRGGDGGIIPKPHVPSHLHRAEGYFLIPCDGSAPRQTFLEWYEEWLDESLSAMDKSNAEPRA